MARELEPCPFCNEVPSTGLCGNRVMHDCKTLKAFISAAVEDWNARYKRTCHWYPLVPDPDNPAESHYEYEGNWKTECGEAYVWSEECFPNFCPNCSGIVIRGAEVADA